MCAINPVHKKRFIIDVYTSHRNMTKEQFDERVMEVLLTIECELNTQHQQFRFHLKESDQQAD